MSIDFLSFLFLSKDHGEEAVRRVNDCAPYGDAAAFYETLHSNKQHQIECCVKYNTTETVQSPTLYSVHKFMLVCLHSHNSAVNSACSLWIAVTAHLLYSDELSYVISYGNMSNTQ